MPFMPLEGNTAVLSNQKTKKKPSRKNSNLMLSRLEYVESPNVTYRDPSFPIVLKKGAGMHVIDVDGNKYLDFTACFGVLALGHRPPSTLSALRKQCAQLIHGMGDVHPTESKIKLLESLARISPYKNAQSILSLSGSEAIESALKTAMLATGRERFVSFADAYHGLQFGPLALNNRKHFTEGFESWIQPGKNLVIPFPWANPAKTCGNIKINLDQFILENGYVTETESLKKLEEALKDKSIAALILEPLQGRGGERCFPEKFVQKCVLLCHKYGTLVIFDEIFTGFGRTGNLFGYELHEVVPDILCVGKALGGGLPLSACIADSKTMAYWGKSTGEARHTSTFLGHPLACAVAHATIAAIISQLPNTKKELKQIDILFNRFMQKCTENGLSEHFPFHLRGQGLMRGIWFHSQKEGFAAQLATLLLEKGHIVLPSGADGRVLALTPPLNIKAHQIYLLLKSLAEILFMLKPQ